ncbi:hypothetical protein KOI35_02870 [Actinoplanes bogorensis]|uniref:Uncharacterized protein n=1 Tax=Paractinoplanes bogorensis TaxID=1610840 RepID=A0ABS5YKF9_9ACTN|nr:hypothetical protein [Actinoplanes bogorensis]MBU2662445.1 hypothetical protein [Actinoplanes bogorensis]
MSSVDRFPPVQLAAAADLPPGSIRVVMILVAVGVLLLTARQMRRAVGPVVEILKAALAAMASFALIGVAVVILLLALLPQ